jgi:hypothetical protein
VKSGVLIVLLVAAPAAAEPAQLQADLGLAVIGVGYEKPLGNHLAVMGEAQVFGTYFLPWFDAGTNVLGFGGEVRTTWFRDPSHHGLYATGMLRINRVADDSTSTVGWSGALLAGYAFPATHKLDVRVGAGAQWMRYLSETIDIDTPFITLDLIVGYRLP